MHILNRWLWPNQQPCALQLCMCASYTPELREMPAHMPSRHIPIVCLFMFNVLRTRNQLHVEVWPLLSTSWPTIGVNQRFGLCLVHGRQMHTHSQLWYTLNRFCYDFRSSRIETSDFKQDRIQTNNAEKTWTKKNTKKHTLKFSISIE